MQSAPNIARRIEAEIRAYADEQQREIVRLKQELLRIKTGQKNPLGMWLDPFYAEAAKREGVE